MKTHFISALRITIVTALFFGVIYPLAITGIAKVIAPGNGNGTALKVNDRIVGFELIGQSITSDRYFSSRPSAVNYNAAATGGSNKGPSNPDYLKQVEERIADFLTKNPGVDKKDIPVDLITASGGGLDPHISPKAALIQAKRIAKARNLDTGIVEELVKNHIETSWLGTSKVHVLKLNIALDELQ